MASAFKVLRGHLKDAFIKEFKSLIAEHGPMIFDRLSAKLKGHAPKLTEEKSDMAKQEVQDAQVKAFQDGVVKLIEDAVGAGYDAGASDQKGSDGTFTQADIDQAVQLATASDAGKMSDMQSADAKALSDAQAKADADMKDLQAKFDDVSSKEGKDQATLQGLSQAIVSMKASLDAFSALVPSASPVDGGAVSPAPAPSVTPAAGPGELPDPTPSQAPVGAQTTATFVK